MGTYKKQHALSLPRLTTAPFAGLFLILACCGLLIPRLNESVNGLVSLKETPYLRGSGCFNVPDHLQVFVCLTADGRSSFATSNPGLQRAIIAQVGKKYGVHFSATDLIHLASMPFLTGRFEAIASTLTGPTPTVSANEEFSRNCALTKAQLLDCIVSAQALSPALTGRLAFIYLSIEANTTARLVMQLTRLLQKQEIHRLHLLTHGYA